MWRKGTDSRTSAGPRKGAALIVVTLLVAVLSAFTMAAVSYYISSVTLGRDSVAEARAIYSAELGRADAIAYVEQNLGGPWPHSQSLTTVLDDQNAPAGEYSYQVTDLTLPMQNQRRLVQVYSYWPTQSRPAAQRRLQVWMEKGESNWSTTAWALGEYSGG